MYSVTSHPQSAPAFDNLPILQPPVSRETEIKHRSSITNRSVLALHRASSSDSVPQNRPLRDPIMLERILAVVNDALLDPETPLVLGWRTRPRRGGGRAVLRREYLARCGARAIPRRIHARIVVIIPSHDLIVDTLHRVEALHDEVRGGRQRERIHRNGSGRPGFLVSGHVRLILHSRQHRHRCVFYSRHRLRRGSMFSSRGRALASSHRRLPVRYRHH